MLRSKKIYIPPSMTLYAAASGLMAISTPEGTITDDEGGNPYTEGLAKGFDFNNIEWYSVNEVGDKITKEFGIDTRMWYE